MERIKADKIAISLKDLNDCINEYTIVFKLRKMNELIILKYKIIKPGTTATVFNALSTATFSKLTKNAT
ncbi:unnamed protein product [Adineta steineri]|uniref:Uncharacterized protein n=1 Tax=Adineta steineri TaxID=433720 RepID=A0A814VPJ6_9BILA|nr:unnamed protein product [Adineta steineri]CAF0947325.1 unnamed protein product [Adineta steineri]CAF1190828.1 unnamed protein product [Adineta steineri]